MFRTKKNFINHETRFLLYELSGLPNHEVVQWLEKNKYEYDEQSLENEYPIWHEFIEYLWHRRKNRHIDIAICRYGKNVKLLSKYKRKNNKTFLRCLLANSIIHNLFSNEELNNIITNFPLSKNELTILFSNKYVDRDFFTNFFENTEFLFKEENELCSALCLSLICKNPKLKEKYDETIMDGWADYQFGRLKNTFPDIIMNAPVTKVWQQALEILFSEIPFQYLEEKIDPEKFLKKWKDTKEEKEKAKNERFYVNHKYYFRLKFLKFYINNILVYPKFAKYHSTTFPEFLVPDHKEKLYREAFFLYSDFTDWFYYKTDELKENIVLPSNFEYPKFKNNSEYFRKDPKKVKLPNFESPDATQLLLIKILSAYKKDGNEFIEWLIRNKNFWKEKKQRDFLHDIAWNLSYDKYSDMHLPNIFNLTGDKFYKDYPDFFKDEEIIENDELDENLQHQGSVQREETLEVLWKKSFNEKRFNEFHKTGFNLNLINATYTSIDKTFSIFVDDFSFDIHSVKRLTEEFFLKSGLNYSQLEPHIKEQSRHYNSNFFRHSDALIIVEKMGNDATEESISYEFTGYNFNKKYQLPDDDRKKYKIDYQGKTFEIDTVIFKVYFKVHERNFDILKYFVQNDSSKNLNFIAYFKNQKENEEKVHSEPNEEGDMIIYFKKEVLFDFNETSIKKEFKKELNKNDDFKLVQNKISSVSENIQKLSNEINEINLVNFDKIENLINTQEETFNKKFKKLSYFFWFIIILLLIFIFYK